MNGEIKEVTVYMKSLLENWAQRPQLGRVIFIYYVVESKFALENTQNDVSVEHFPDSAD